MNKKFTVASIILGVGVAAVVYFRPWQSQGSEKQSFKEIKVQRGAVESSFTSTGIVQPENRLEVKPPIAGRVEEVLVNEGQLVKKGELLAWMSSTERAAIMDAARAKGELRKWERLYRPTPLLAPLEGTVISRNVESGQTVTSADALVVMSNRLTIKAQVDETDIAKIQLKQPTTIRLDAYPNQSFEGHVDQIAFEAKTVNNVTTYLVDVLPETAPEFMRSGMTASVQFTLEKKEGILVIPSDAIKYQEGRPVVTTRQPTGDPIEREIETGLSDGKMTEVVQGLTEDEAILLPEFRLKGKKEGKNPFGPPSVGRRSH